MNNTLGKFCSVAKKNTVIFPKKIPGYNTPEGVVLKEDGQQINFIYTPIHYNIKYNYNGGKILSQENLKNSYTVEDPEYIPPIPVKENCTFIGWEPSRIPAKSIGDITFKAQWRKNAILVSGKELHDIFSKLANGVENIAAIKKSSQLLEGEYINISSTSTPIIAKFDSGIIYIYSEYDIYCNQDMSETFSDFILLSDISGLFFWNCNSETNITNIFYNCPLLSDLSWVEYWADGKLKNYNNAFSGTSALSSGRVPSWYKINAKINYKLAFGKNIFASKEGLFIPEEIIYPRQIDGYKAITKSIQIEFGKNEYDFIYESIS